MKKLLILIIFILFLATPKVVAAATIYVNYTSGNDTTGDGSLGNPYKTFNKGYTVALPNDTLNLTGTFDWSNADETGDASVTGYTIAKNLTLQGQSATDTFIQAANAAYTANSRVFTVNSGVNFTINDLTIRYGYRNVDSWSGTAISSSGNLTILDSMITENANPARFGGAAINYNGSGRFIMRNSTIYNNGNLSGSWRGYTGAIDGGSSDLNNEITNCTFFDNKAEYNGALYISSGRLTITNSTFVNNYATVSGIDIHVWSSAVIYLKNNIFADRAYAYEYNLATGAGGQFVDGGYNIIEYQTGTNFVNGVNGNLVGEQANLNIAGSLSLNSSTNNTYNLALSSGSVAINAGDPADSANNGVAIPGTDQRGYYRSGSTDIGAYEYGGTINIDQPTTQASSATFTNVSYGQMTINWTNGNGAKRAVFVKQADNGTAVPVDNTTYTANTAFGSGTQIGSSGWYNVYNSTGTSVTVTGLSPSTSYIAQVFEYNGPAGVENYLTDSATDNPKVQATTAVNRPSTQANSLSFSSVQYTQMTVSWSNGNGEKRIAFIKQASTGTATPIDSTTYTANAVFGSGSQIGSSGWYAIYNSTGTSVTVTGLTPATDYIVQVFEYNGSAGIETYFIDTATNNPKTQASATVTEPTAQATNLTFSSVVYTSMTIGWTNGNGTKRAVFVKQASSDTATPVDNTGYTANTAFGSGTQIGTSGWYCIYNSTGTSVTVTGLSASTTYLAQVFEYNDSGAVINYNANTATDNPKSQATTASPTQVTLGSGTSTTGVAEASPVNIWYRSLHGQSIYTKAELNAAGVNGSTIITQVGFYVASTPSYPLPNFVIRMKHTSNTSFTSSMETASGMTTVYSVASYTPTAGGFDLLTLTTPFTWNGTDNIVIDTAFSQTTWYAQTGTVRYYTTTGGYITNRSDSSDQTNNFSGGVISTSKPQIKLSLQASDTTAPTITSVSSSTANGSYKAGSVIDINVTFSENVTSTGNVTVTLDTGRTCTFSVSNSSTGTCNYTVQTGDTSADLNAVISGTIADQASNAMSNFTPATTLSTNKNIIIDTTNPTISNFVINSANISWVTNEATSTSVEYGLVSSFGSNTIEADVDVKIIEHNVTLLNLKPCARYYARAKSRDAAGNWGVSLASNFVTAGCLTSVISGGNETSMPTSGGTLSTTTNKGSAQITAPNNFLSENSVLQLNKLNNTSVPTFPTNKRLIDDNFYDLLAVGDSGTTITSFNQPITFTVSYGSDAENTYDETTLDVYKYTGSDWIAQNCQLNTVVNTLTCTLTSFSTYGVLGEELAISSVTTTSTTSTPTSILSCNDQKPIDTPNLFQIDAGKDFVILYFTAVSPVSEYFVNYWDRKNNQYGAVFNIKQSSGVVAIKVSSLSKNENYIFKVRGGNGCATGDWSNSKSMSTLIPQQTATSLSPPIKSCTYTIKPGDTLWTIAQENLGSGALYSQIIKNNIDQYPNISQNLKVGSQLNLCEEKTKVEVPVVTPQKPSSKSPRSNNLFFVLIMIIITIINLCQTIPSRKRKIILKKCSKLLL